VEYKMFSVRIIMD